MDKKVFSSKTLINLIKAKASGLKHAKEATFQISPHRNKPCPCGSGKKYKHCCKEPK